MIERQYSLMLAYLFNRVPAQQVTVWDWHTREGDLFLTMVDELVELHGVDINEIGSLIGIRNFSQRYRMLKRGTSDNSTIESGGDGVQSGESGTVRVQPGMPEVRGPTAEQGREGGSG